jgi:hypothetical protein
MSGSIDQEDGELVSLPARLRPFRAHPFLTLAVAGVLVGGGLRFVPTSTASGSGAGASTACAAT